MPDSAREKLPSVFSRPSEHMARNIDDQLAQSDLFRALKTPPEGWTRWVRYALGIAGSDLARKLNISQPAISKLEASELAGTISIGKLDALAAAMDCEFVYGFLPKGSFEGMAQRINKKQNAARKAKRRIPRAIDV
jgi:predicted DNA-binding mobile mystery protein A